MTFNLSLEETDSWLFTCVLKKLYFLIFMQTISKYYLCFHYKIMKKLYMRTIICSHGSDCILIKVDFLKIIYSGLVSTTTLPLNLYTGRKTNPILIQFNAILKQLNWNLKSNICWYYLMDANVISFF